MNYHFNSKIAKKYGVNEAIFLQNISYWIMKNKANEKNFHDEYYWTYNSNNAFTKIFEFWSHQNIKTIIKNLIQKNIIKIGNYNKLGFDQTKWYTIINNEVLKILLDDEDFHGIKQRKLDALEAKKFISDVSADLLDLTNAVVTTNHTIPDIKPDIKQNPDSLTVVGKANDPPSSFSAKGVNDSVESCGKPTNNIGLSDNSNDSFFNMEKLTNEGKLDKEDVYLIDKFKMDS